MVFKNKTSRSKKFFFESRRRGPRNAGSATTFENKTFFERDFFFENHWETDFFSKSILVPDVILAQTKLIKKNVFLTIWTTLFMQLGITIFMCLIWLEEFTSWCEWEIIVLDWEDQTFAKQEISMKQMICQACVFGNFYHYQKEFGTKNCFWKFIIIWNLYFVFVYHFKKKVGSNEAFLLDFLGFSKSIIVPEMGLLKR